MQVHNPGREASGGNSPEPIISYLLGVQEIFLQHIAFFAAPWDSGLQEDVIKIHVGY
jgi:hypothetical protein